MFCLEKGLLDLFDRSGIKGLKGEFDPKGNFVTLEGSDLKIIIDYAKDNKIDYLFYSYNYANKDYYLIDYSKLEKDGDFLRLASNDIETHNDIINSIDFKQPAILDVFCLHNGVIINICNYALWLDGLISSEECIAKLKEKYGTELDDIKEKRNEEREEILEELKPILLNNEEFALCTNQNLRREFMRKFLARKENERFRNAFFNENGYLNPYETLNFADLVYAIYKKTSKR